VEDFDEHDFCLSAHWRMIDGFQKGLAGKGNYCHWAMGFGAYGVCIRGHYFLVMISIVPIN